MKDGPEVIFDSIHELFGDLFGTTSRDLRAPLLVELAEAAEGGERTVELSRATSCRACRGRGGAPGATYRPCTACGDRGAEQRMEGPFAFSKTCDACHGARGRWSATCPACEGRRETRKTKKLRVTIPPGVAAGHVLRLAGQGNDLGEGPGDALLTIELARHPTLRRDGDDLHARVRLDEELAERGGETRVPWLTGTARVRVPPGTTHGSEARVHGWGCVRFGARYAPPPSDASPYRSSALPARGDLVVTFATHDDDEDEPSVDAGPTPMDLSDVFAHATREDPVDRALRSDDAQAPTAATPHLFALGAALVALAALAAAFWMR